jgi:hypothetical protein
MVANMFFGLAGRNWVNGVWAFAIGPVMVAAVIAGCWLFEHPEYLDDLLVVVPWVLASAAALKLLVAGWSLRALCRRRLVAAPLMTRLLIAWVVTAACLIALIHWLVPGNLAPSYLVVSCVVLVLPLVRISLAPLALAWNRHR